MPPTHGTSSVWSEWFSFNRIGTERRVEHLLVKLVARGLMQKVGDKTWAVGNTVGVSSVYAPAPGVSGDQLLACALIMMDT
jgi:hypothetical protein